MVDEASRIAFNEWKSAPYTPLVHCWELEPLTPGDLERGITKGALKVLESREPKLGKAYPWIDDEYLNGDEQDSAPRNYRGVGHFPRP